MALAELAPVTVDPAERFGDVLLVVVPHMDDEVLACGGTIALIRPELVHLVYATDGAGSPAPVVPGLDRAPADLPELRRQESRAALAELGVAAENLRFLDLPDGRLQRRTRELEQTLGSVLRAIRPHHVFVPFRYDRHRDHVAINRVIHRLCRDGKGRGRPEILEYFVYHRWRLLPGGDVRAYVDPTLLLEVDIRRVAARKRAALERFLTQTTCYYPWQTRPNLSTELLDEACTSPELFLLADPRRPGADVLKGAKPWIRMAHRVEPALKRAKDRAVALARRAVKVADD